MKEKCGGTFPEIVIARGDLASPESRDAVDRVADRIAASRELGRFHAVGFTDILGLHALLAGPPAAATASGPDIAGRGLLEIGRRLARLDGDARRAVPRDPEQVREAVRALYADPAWSGLARMFVSPDLSLGTLLLLGGDAGTDVESVERVWRELDAVTASAGGPTRLSFLGYRTMAYLFVTHSLDCIRTMALVSLAVVLALTALCFRERRAVVVVGLLMATSTLVWFGVLQLFGIYISIFLLFPLVFAVCVGSDYALHILSRLHADRLESPGASGLEWTRRAWTSTGRAVAVAALTDAGVFLVFSRTDLVSASQVMLAVALAVFTIFASTIVLVPALGLPRTRPAPGTDDAPAA
jgi:hypothetical protein